jgi:hypothetical protein
MFCDELEDTMKMYPNLKILQNGEGLTYLKGILDIHNDIGIVVGNFLIEVYFSNQFPYRFPHLLEIGGVIPNEADWHKYSDERCCITVPADEIIKCRNKITVPLFIEKFAIPYFANYLYRKQTGKYKNGEYAHGKRGIFQFYELLLKTNNKNLWIQFYKNTFRDLKVSCGRNDLCFCGCNMKYKNCHLQVFNNLKLIGEEQVLNDFKLIM